MKRRELIASTASAGAAVIAGCLGNPGAGDQRADSGDLPEPRYGDPDRTYRLSAAESTVGVSRDEQYDGWTYDGSYPGPEIRAVEGERVRIVLENDLPEETTIHWHGMVLEGDNAMDGVPGVTQTAVAPGEEFVYEFAAEPAGTHWYHSHVGLQLDRELLGPLIIEEREPHVEYDSEETLILDEYLPSEPRVESSRGGMGGMGGTGGGSSGAPPSEGTLVNGKLSTAPASVVVDEGDRIRLRLINAAAAETYDVSIDDHALEVTHADGTAVDPVTVDHLQIGMGERYDVVVEATSPGRWPIRVIPVDGSTDPGLAILNYEGREGSIDSGSIGSRRLQYSDLQAVESLSKYDGEPDRTVDLTLSARGEEWVIDGQTYLDADPIRIEEGDHIRFRMVNRSPVRHPMHLHGHHFMVGDALKDTVIVPEHMGSVSVDFVADNPGAWFIHCHHLYHMETGMARVVSYE